MSNFDPYKVLEVDPRAGPVVIKAAYQALIKVIGALKTIIAKDSQACVSSRLLLSVVESPVPSCADLLELAYLHDIGYRRMLLCDELCLKENMLGTAVAVFDGVKKDL